MNKNTQKATNLQQPQSTPQLQPLSLTELESIAGGPEDPFCPNCIDGNCPNNN